MRTERLARRASILALLLTVAACSNPVTPTRRERLSDAVAEPRRGPNLDAGLLGYPKRARRYGDLRRRVANLCGSGRWEREMLGRQL